MTWCKVFRVCRKPAASRFYCKIRDTFLPIELKYQSAIRRDDLFGIIDFMKGGNSSKKGIIVTKEGFSEEEDYVKLPLSLLLFIM